ncbi:zinc finger X-chromosomal protein-like isoform X2 [Pectinophora gossypiella]|uniref:zinc finger X-chromosomal protein-like isoform X2 n=1 Tax=Pectinophora gossypiella TaxID=13191 RepID=UPI00214ED52C|nr:zinc finger X-chromosomal protein-like isoform X2 [Pectinophora gossypiella]
MAESDKKSSRKLKLVPRNFEEYEDDIELSLDTQKTTVTQEQFNQSMFHKIKDKINEEPDFEPSTSVNFSVQVEVEQMEAPTEEIEKRTFAVLTNTELRSEMEKVMSTTTSLADKILEIDIRNQWGKYTQAVQLSDYDIKIQNAITEWKFWRLQSKFRRAIVAYKCYICKIGWWHLTPFRDHILQHEDINVNIDTAQNDCYIIAWKGEPPVSLSEVKIEGNCWQCLQKFEKHSRNTLPTNAMYVCLGCLHRKPSCAALFEHEGVCQRYQKIIFEHEMATESLWTCTICSVACLSSKRYLEHMMLNHSPRSDLPILFPAFQRCSRCDVPILHSALHMCSHKDGGQRCKFCNRPFQTKPLRDAHEKFTKKNYLCKVCNIVLVSQCKEPQHMLVHTQNYVLAYKCRVCSDTALFKSREDMYWHRILQHPGKNKIKDLYEAMIVPKSCMTSKWLARNPFDGNDDLIVKKPADAKVESKDDGYMKVNKSGPGKVYTFTGNQIAKTTKFKMAPETENSQGNCPIKYEVDDTCASLDDTEIDTKHAILDDDDDDVLVIDDVQVECVIGDAGDSSQDTMDIKEEIIDANTNSNEENDTKDTIKIKQEVITESSNQEDNDTKIYMEENDLSQNTVNIKQEIIDKDSKLEDNFKQEDNDYRNVQDIIEINDSSQDTVEIKQEIMDEDMFEAKADLNEHETTFGNVKIKTEVVIKEEKEDYKEFDEDNNDIMAEHEACLAELSKVFQASKRGGSIELSGICMSEDLVVKEESDDDYEDIIKLDHCYEMNTERYKNSDSETSRKETVENDEANRNPQPEIRVTSEQSRLTIPVTANTSSYTKSARKIYHCSRCSFLGIYAAFKSHVDNVCPRKKHDSIKYREDKRLTRKEYVCTKCNDKFTHIMSYAAHFRKHGLCIGTCPECRKSYKNASEVSTHIMGHIRTSFLKVQVLNDSSFVTSKSSGLYQCKTCSEKVRHIDFFPHWERHLKLREENSDVKKSVVKNRSLLKKPVARSDSPGETVLPPESLQMTLDMLLSPLEPRTSDTNKKCALCSRKFDRRNDVKRHLIEHLLRDAAANNAHASRGLLVLRCQLCHQEFNKTDGYRMHMRNHGALPLYKCEMCNKCFSDSSNFAKHKKTHNYGVMLCDICHKKFHSRAGIERHMEMHQTTDPIKCEPCNKTFYSASTYRKHVKALHDKASHRQFRKANDVKSHLRDEHLPVITGYDVDFA